MDLSTEFVLRDLQGDFARRGCACRYWIPIKYRDCKAVQSLMRREGLKARYRGPRRYDRFGTGYHTLKADATHFSLYNK